VSLHVILGCKAFLAVTTLVWVVAKMRIQMSFEVLQFEHPVTDVALCLLILLAHRRYLQRHVSSDQRHYISVSVDIDIVNC
jgi:hypothetical protein